MQRSALGLGLLVLFALGLVGYLVIAPDADNEASPTHGETTTSAPCTPWEPPPDWVGDAGGPPPDVETHQRALLMGLWKPHLQAVLGDRYGGFRIENGHGGRLVVRAVDPTPADEQAIGEILDPEPWVLEEAVYSEAELQRQVFGLRGFYDVLRADGYRFHSLGSNIWGGAGSIHLVVQQAEGPFCQETVDDLEARVLEYDPSLTAVTVELSRTTVEPLALQ